MQHSDRMPDAELRVMLVLWEADRPLRPSEIGARLRAERAWSRSTVQSMLNRLTARGCAEESREKRFRYYRAVVGRDEYCAQHAASPAARLFGGILQTALVAPQTLSDTELNELERILIQARRAKDEMKKGGCSE